LKQLQVWRIDEHDRKEKGFKNVFIPTDVCFIPAQTKTWQS